MVGGPSPKGRGHLPLGEHWLTKFLGASVKLARLLYPESRQGSIGTLFTSVAPALRPKMELNVIVEIDARFTKIMNLRGPAGAQFPINNAQKR